MERWTFRPWVPRGTRSCLRLTPRMMSPMDAPPETGAEPLPQLMGRSAPPPMGATGEQQTPTMIRISKQRGSAMTLDFTAVSIGRIAMMESENAKGGTFDFS